MYNLAAVTSSHLGYELRRFTHSTIKGSGKYEIAKVLSTCNHKVIAQVEFNTKDEVENALIKLKKDYNNYIFKGNSKSINVVKRLRKPPNGT